MPNSGEFKWDAFLSHASEDKDSFVEPLAIELRKYGLKIWFDKFTLRVGSSLRESIDEGLAKSQFGIVVLSHDFFAKNWPQKELNALFSRQVNGRDVIFPIWHGLSKNDLLGYSPLLSDIVAVNSDQGIAAVARSLVEIIRPEAFQFEATRQDAQNAATRMRERLKKANPELDSRITFGPQGLDPLKTISIPTNSDVVVTGTQDGMRIEVFAPDKEAYSKNPLSFNLKMTTQAWEKLQTAHNEGRVVELGPDEVIGVASDVFETFNLGKDSGFSAVHKLIVAPPFDVMQRKLRAKLTFAFGGESEEFPYVEFRVIRPGAQEFEIQSFSPGLPLQISITLNLAGGLSEVKVSYSCAGYEIRQLHKTFRAIRLLSSGGVLEIFNLETDRRLGTLSSTQQTSIGSEAVLYSVVHDAYEVATALNETLIWPEDFTMEDCSHIQLLRELVSTGRVLIPVKKIILNLMPSTGVDLNAALGESALVRVDLDNPPEFATVFGKTLNLGPYSIVIGPRHCEIVVDEHDSRLRIVSIAPAEPVFFQIEKFCRGIAPSAGPSAS
ncbi:MAG TPA: toll/interleukin-1 receptor domain-containing protein [Armatimonadota bacterium]